MDMWQSDNLIEKRDHPRLLLSLPAQVLVEGGGKITTYTHDISDGGLALVVEQGIPDLMSGAQVTIQIDGFWERPNSIMRVVGCYGERVGLQYLEM